MTTRRRQLVYAVVKRSTDVLLSLAALLVFFPLMLLIGVLVRAMLGPPVLFWQPRPGYKGRIFLLAKFRTMSPPFYLNGRPATDQERLGRFGRLLRATSLDELPQLFNVLRGEMSFVGPRPLLVEYLPRYSERQSRRHEVRPGITGYAQVNGRNALTWDEKFDLDLWYVEHQSIWCDLKILALTVWKVFRSEGVSHSVDTTMPPFEGNIGATRVE